MASQPATKRKRKQRARPTAAAPATAAVAPVEALAVHDTPAVDLDHERRFGRIAAVCGFASVLLTIGSVPVAATGPKITAVAGSDQQLLLQVGVTGNSQLISMWMRVASALVLVAVAWFLYGATRGRNPGHGRWVPWLGLAGFVLVGVSTAVGFFETRDAAYLFIHDGPHTLARARDILDHQRDLGPLRAADVGRLIGAVLFGLWISIAAWEGTRVGLFTRFLGVFGVAAGFTSVVGIPISTALFLGWLGSFACLAWGWWPDGRPLAWELGRAVSWDEADAMNGTT